MAKVELKQPIVDEIISNVKEAESVVLVNYSGLTVEQDTVLRKELREAGVQYKVYKNTMMHRAFEGTQCEELIQHLHGTNALAISADDATAPARILDKFAKKNPALELVAGIVEGNYNDQAGIQALAGIPSREELLGKLLGSIQSPITNFARVLNQIAEKNGGLDDIFHRKSRLRQNSLDIGQGLMGLLCDTPRSEATSRGVYGQLPGCDDQITSADSL